MKMKRYKSDAFEALHESMKDLYELGGISDERMREFDEACLVKPGESVPRVSTQKPAARTDCGILKSFSR
jgi:DNA-binding transcriptional regulator YiaG